MTHGGFTVYASQCECVYANVHCVSMPACNQWRNERQRMKRGRVCVCSFEILASVSQ